MCNEGITFDVYVEIEDPEVRITVENVDDRVAVEIGDPHLADGRSCLRLWLKEPDAAVDIGSNLIKAGEQLIALRMTSSDDDNNFPLQT
ncbi:MAG: hypothetical protein GEV28_10950 [Actinophytocola sp.]|uniref:hypothetical protein n=1 Tax=Actinophytocola sp. TaxID=1872138 RepID=UPI0013255519|nr:hypothetical protein [Actinophytocola sp.]MPZ80877.1 hypothetical protein [Actinophytocola sp.]